MKKIVLAVLLIMMAMPALASSEVGMDWDQVNFKKEPPYIMLSEDAKELTACTAFIYKFETEEGTEYEWKSSDIDIAYVWKNGRFQASAPGTAIITGSDKNKIGNDIEISVTVPDFYVSSNEITFTEPGAIYFVHNMQSSGSMEMSMDGKGDVFNAGMVPAQAAWPDVYKIVPLKAGEGKIVYRVNGKTITVNVVVEESAVSK